MKARGALVAVLFCVACSGPASSPPLPAAPTPSPFAPCPGAPPTPTLYPPPTPPFSIAITPDPIWVGVDRRSGGMDGPVVPNNGVWRMAVLATGQLHGSITQVERALRDRQSGALLGRRTDSGPFLENGGTPCRVFDPLLAYGNQRFAYNDDLGFMGRSAILETTITILDTAGRNWSVSQTSSWELLPPPVPRSPVRTIVRQNDPESGCPFDPVHGYGLLLNLSWDPPARDIPDIYYYVEVSDGAGRPLIVNSQGVRLIYTTSATSVRIPQCGVHVDSLGEHGATFALASGVLASLAVSGWSVATFDFQSCRAAGTPACH